MLRIRGRIRVRVVKKGQAEIYCDEQAVQCP